MDISEQIIISETVYGALRGMNSIGHKGHNDSHCIILLHLRGGGGIHIGGI